MTKLLVAGEGVRVPHIVTGVMKDVDVRETDHPDDKDAERQGQN
jgi:hypothetical protein